MGKLASRGAEGKNKDHLIGRLRIGDLNKFFTHRYGGSRETYVFPDDDSGLEDLKILIHSYAWSNPLAIPRIIKIRAPWADAEAIISEVDAYPKKWRAATLGTILNYTGAEHRRLRLRTIAPVDITPEERADYSRILANGRRRKKRRLKGMKTRPEYLAANSLSREKPWKVEGISRAEWYRRRTKAETSLAGIKLYCRDSTCLKARGIKQVGRRLLAHPKACIARLVQPPHERPSLLVAWTREALEGGLKPRCRACHRRPVSVDLYCSRCLETGRVNPRPKPPKAVTHRITIHWRDTLQCKPVHAFSKDLPDEPCTASRCRRP